MLVVSQISAKHSNVLSTVFIRPTHRTVSTTDVSDCPATTRQNIARCEGFLPLHLITFCLTTFAEVWRIVPVSLILNYISTVGCGTGLCSLLAFPFRLLLGTAIWAESESLAGRRPNQFAASPHARAGAGGSRPTLLALAFAAFAVVGDVFPADFVTDDIGATHLGARLFEVNVPTTLAELRCVRTCLIDDFRSAAFAPSRPEVFVYACASTSPTIKCFARFGIEPT